MLGAVLGWMVRGWWERRRAPKPAIVYEGEITLNEMTAGPLRAECELGEYDPKTGCRPLIREGKKVPQSSRLTTWLSDLDGIDKMTIRWEKRAGNFRLARARKGEVWRIEFHKVQDRESKPASPSPVVPIRNPFGGGEFLQ